MRLVISPRPVGNATTCISVLGVSQPVSIEIAAQLQSAPQSRNRLKGLVISQANKIQNTGALMYVVAFSTGGGDMCDVALLIIRLRSTQE